MKIRFVNRGLLNMIEPLGIKEDDIKTVDVGESTFIIVLKNKTIITKGYKLTNDFELIVEK